MSSFKCISLPLGMLAVVAMAPIANAQEADSFNQAGVVEITLDRMEDGQDVIAATVEYGLAVRFAEGWTVSMDAVLEPVVDPTGDAAFEGEDAFVETLSVQYAGDNFTIYGGKINPVFGSAADLAPGLYGVEAGESYQLTEAIGVGGDVSLAPLFGAAGEHVLSAAVFMADRTVLSGSLGGLRDELELSDGGLANTDGLQSFALSLDGALVNSVGYTIGYRHLATDTPGETGETITVVGMNYVAPEDSGLDLALMGEVAFANDADGIDGANRDFYTAGATLGLGPWALDGWYINAVASGWSEDAAAGAANVRKLEVSIGASITEALGFEFGLQQVRTSGGSDIVAGARLAWAFGE